MICTSVALAAISLSTSTAYTQNFDGMGIPATATTASTLPADFRADAPATVRTVGSFSSAGATAARAGGANLSTSASNGIYNFGSGTATLGGSDRAVGFLSSGTATASGNLYGQFVNNTGGTLSGLKISYDVEKYRNGSNPAGFRIQLFYSTDGNTWTNAGANFLTSFPADANNNGFAAAPGATVSVTNQTLSATISSGGTFYLAWNYSVTANSTTTNAQALAIDNVSVLGLAGSTGPSGVGAASPGSVQAGSSTLLAVTVTPGSNPASTSLAVTGDLTSIGGSANQQFFDDGTHGDLTAGDNVFSFQAPVPANTSTGGKTIPATITDAQNRTGSASISLTVTPAATAPTGTGSASPASLQPGSTTLLTVSVTPGSNPASSGINVTGDLSSIGGSSSQQFSDNGNNTFSYQAALSAGTSSGAKSLPFTVADAQGRSSTSAISLTVLPPTTVKISQVYGGGGNSGSTYTNDYIELYNSGGTTVDITGWSVQYHSATTTGGWAATPVCPAGTCTIAPGHYYLVQEAQGAGGTTALPTPDATGTINLGATNGQVALVAGTAALPAFCSLNTSVVDLVGYGSATCSESGAASALNNTTAAVRRGNGCQDTDNNASDIVAVGPIPRDSSSPVNSCGGDATEPSGLGIASPSALDPASNVMLTVKVTPATAPPSTGLTVNADLTGIGGSATQQFYDDGTNGDVTAGDNTFSFQATVAPNITTGVKNIVATVTDAQARVVKAPITLTVQSPSCGVERWSVKVGTDADVSLVDLQNPVHTTIAQLRSFTPPPDPPGPPDNSRVVPPESTVYVVDATMTLYKKETDVDYHIVLQDSSGQTIIAEIPSPACVLTPTSPRQLVTGPFSGGITSAREKFDARFTATTFFQTANVPVRVKGVAFFDFIHGQTGVAPNGIELHPVLDIEFTANTTTTLASSQSSPNPSQYGDQVAITATVSNGGAAATPTGNVTFYDGGQPVDTVTLDQSGQATFTSHTLSAGSHSITASYEGDDASAPSTSTALVQVVNKAAANVSVNGYTGTYDGHSHGATGAATGVDGENLTSLLDLGASFTDVPGGTAHWTFAGNDNYNSSSGDASVVITQATATVNVSGYTGTYDGNAHGATGSATGVNGEDLSGLLHLGEAYTNVPGGTAHWTFDGNNNYAQAGGTASIEIAKANAVIHVTGYDVTYDGGAHTATGTATGLESSSPVDLSALLDLSGTTHTDAGSYPNDSWSFAGNNNYNATAGTVADQIAKAGSLTTVTCPQSETYDGSALEPCTASYSGAGGLTGTLTPSYTDNVNAGTATASATYGGDANHDASSNAATFQITKAMSAVTVVCPPSATYTGDALTPCTATATGAGNLSDSLAVNYANNTNVGTAIASAAYPGDANHEGGDGSKQFDIKPAATTTTVSCPSSATYSGSAVEPCTATVTGAGGLNQSLTVSYANNTNAGTATATASYAGDSNHAGSSGSQTFTIGKSSSTTTVTCAAGPFTYNGSAQTPCTASVTGAGGLNQSLSVSYSNNVNAGTAGASASFAGDANHDGSSDSKSFAIGKATPSFSNLSSPSITYGTASTSLSGKLGLGSLVPTGSVAITLNGVTQSAPVQADGSFSSGFATAQLAPTNPPYAVAYSYGGDPNFNAASGAGTLTVGYGFAALYDQTAVHNSGSTIPVKLAITNAAGSNISSATTTVTAVGVALISTTVYGPVEDAGNANPDNNFRFDSTLTTRGGYVFNLKSTGLATGIYSLYFRVGADPTPHAVQFQVR